MRKRGREGERRERDRDVWEIQGLVTSRTAPKWGPGLQPKHVTLLGIKLVIFGFAGWHSIHWAILARAGSTFLEGRYLPTIETAYDSDFAYSNTRNISDELEWIFLKLNCWTFYVYWNERIHFWCFFGVLLIQKSFLKAFDKKYLFFPLYFPIITRSPPSVSSFLPSNINWISVICQAVERHNEE